MIRQRGPWCCVADGITSREDHSHRERGAFNGEAGVQFVAGDPGQVHITDNHTQTVFAVIGIGDVLQCLLGVCHFGNSKPLTLKPAFERESNPRFVIDDECTRYVDLEFPDWKHGLAGRRRSGCGDKTSGGRL